MKAQLLITLGLLLSAPAVSHAQTSFTQITNGAIVTDLGHFAAPVWGDFANRGLLDLLVANHGGTNVFYRNNGDGTFTKVTQGNLVQDVAYHTGGVAADYDNDGSLDLAVIAGTGAPSMQPNALYHNNGDGTFTPVSGGGLTNSLGFFNSGAWVDYDHDGFADLLVAQADPNGVGRTNLLFHNNRDGTFSSIASAVTSDALDVASLAWVDYDNDGFADLIIASAGGTSALNHSFLYHNNRDGTFTRILTNAVATDTWPNGAWTPTFGDYDNDGLPDLFVAGMETGNRLYHNDGNGAFSAVAAGPMLQAPTGGGSRACGWGDFDNDGYLDLCVVSYNAPNRLFHNNGDGTFTQVTDAAFTHEANASIGCQTSSCVDYDNDGFLDLFVTRFADSGTTHNLLYHNNGNTNAWLKVNLVGSASNRSAIGAKVRVHATIGGKTFWQLREISGGGGRWVQPLVAHFGLGDATNADTVRIEWPSGIVQILTNVPARQTLTVVEHQSPGTTNAPSFTGASHLLGGPANLSVSGVAGLIYVLESSTNLVNWTKIGVAYNATGIVSFTDTKATNYAGRFYRVSIP